MFFELSHDDLLDFAATRVAWVEGLVAGSLVDVDVHAVLGVRGQAQIFDVLFLQADRIRLLDFGSFLAPAHLEVVRLLDVVHGELAVLLLVELFETEAVDVGVDLLDGALVAVAGLGLDDADDHLELEGGALAYLRFDVDGALHGLDDVPADHETEPNALLIQPSLVVQLPERLEQLGQLFRRDSNPSILYLEIENPLRVVVLEDLGLLSIKPSVLTLSEEAVARDSQRDVALAGKFQRIANQVDEDLLHPFRIRQNHLRHIGCPKHPHFDTSRFGLLL